MEGADDGNTLTGANLDGQPSESALEAGTVTEKSPSCQS